MEVCFQKLFYPLVICQTKILTLFVMVRMSVSNIVREDEIAVEDSDVKSDDEFVDSDDNKDFDEDESEE